MSEFIKKNTALVVVLGATALAAIALIALVVTQYSDINGKMTNIDEINAQINQITAQTNPRVVKKNAELINEEAVALEQKTKEQQRVFGCYLDKAVIVFIETLQKEAVTDDFKAAVNEMTITSLHDILAGKIGENFNVQNPSVKAINDLFQDVEGAILEKADEKDMAAYNKAFEAFCAEASKNMLVNLTAKDDPYAARKAVFLQALGLPRSFEDGFVLAEYFSKYANNLIDAKKIPFANMDADNIESRIRIFFTEHDNFSGGEIALDERIGNSNIPFLMTRIQIYENLIINMVKSNVKLCSLYRQGELAPDSDENGYDTYTTTVKVYGTLPEIREFANALHQEYQNNRLYTVTYLSISTDDPTGKKYDTSKHSKEITNALSYVKLVDETTRKESQDGGEEDSKQAEKNKKTINDNWGAALIGVNDKVYAVFHINYIVFTGDQVTNATK